MRRIMGFAVTLLTAFSLGFALDLASAQTGSVKTQAQLNTEIGTTGCSQPTCLYPDNTQGLITPFGLRQGLLDIVATMFNGPGALMCSNNGDFPVYSTGAPGWVCSTSGGSGFGAVLNGGLQLSPQSGTIGQGFNVGQTGPTTGSQTGPFAYNIITTTSNGYALTGTGLDAFGLLQGNLAALRVNFTASNNGGGGGDVAANYGAIFAVKTATSPAAEFIGSLSSVYNNFTNNSGNLWGSISRAQVDSSGTIFKIIAHASEIGVTTGATASYRMAYVAISEGAVQGSTLDAAFVASGASVGFGSPVGWHRLITTSSQFGFAPLDTSADIFWFDQNPGPVQAQVTNFCNCSNLFVTGAVLLFNHINLPGAPSSDFVLPTHNAGAFQFGSLNAAGVAVEIDAFTGPALFLGRRADTSSTSPSAVQSNEVVTGISAQAYDGSAYHEIAGFSFRAQDTQTTTDHGSVIAFLTTPTTASAAEQQVGFINASGQWFLGTALATAPTGPVLIASKNTATTLPSLSSTVQIIDVDANSTILDLFGSTAATGDPEQIRLFASRGTIASPTAVQSGDILGGWLIYGYGGGYRTDSGVGFSGTAAENFTSTTAGEHLNVFTTPVGTHAITQAARFVASGCFAVGTLGDCGAGVINVLTGYRIGNAAAGGNVLRGNGTNFVSAQLAAADLSNSTTGSGAVVLATSPTFITGITTPLLSVSAAGTVAAPTISLPNNTGLYGVSTTGLGLTVNGVLKLDYGISTTGQWTFIPSVINIPNTIALGGTAPGALSANGAINFFGSSSTGIYVNGTLVINFPTSGGSTGVCIGCTTDPGLGGLQLNGQFFMPNITTSSAAQNGTVCWTTGTGKFTVDTTVGCLTSLEEAKDIHEHMTPSECIAIVRQLDAFSFRYRQGWGDSGHYEQFGLGAHHTANVDERLVGRDPDGNLQGVRYMELTAILSCAIKGIAEATNTGKELAR